MPQRVKLYEQNARKRGAPLWGWVLLLVVVLTVLVMFFAHRADQVPARPASAPTGAPASRLVAPEAFTPTEVRSALLFSDTGLTVPASQIAVLQGAERSGRSPLA